MRIKVIAREARDKFARDQIVNQGAVLRIDDREYIAEVKAWAQHVPLGAIVDMVKRYPNGMLVADYVNPKMAERLRNLDVQFFDTAGNAFIRTPYHHIWVKGNRKAGVPTRLGRPRKRRAFTATGLKVTYALLRRPDLIDEPYRVIAATADVALGTVGQVIDDLAAAGLLIVERNGKRRLVRLEALLETWVERYPAALRPKLQLGYFQAPQADWWIDFPITEFGGLWAGEIAGAYYTHYLQPVVATIYMPKEKLNALIAKARLRRLVEPTYEAKMVEILAPFWDRGGNEGMYVHPILAYADLIGTGDARNLEVAQKLFDERIARYFR
ncbi:MAG TPA: type IV toxin-antitoxin system AbiEi family antitoxin [Pseudomonadales bacterium]